MNCLGEHPPGRCPEPWGEHLAQAGWVAQEIGLSTLAWRRDQPQVRGWRQRLEGAPPDEDVPALDNAALVEQLSFRFTLGHAIAYEQRLAGQLEHHRQQRRLRPETAQRVDELLSQADAVLGTTVSDRVVRARRYLDAARELDSLDPRVLLRQGFVQAQAGRPADAAQAFQQAAGVLPSGALPPLSGSALLLASRARFLADQQREAWDLCTQAEALLPNDGGVHYQKALVASRYPQADRSLKLCLRRAIELDPLYYVLAALDPAFDAATWSQAVLPLLQEMDDQGVQALLQARDACREQHHEIEDIAASPAFSQLPPETGGPSERGRDAQAETSGLLTRTRALLGGVEGAVERGPATRCAHEAALHDAQTQIRHWTVAWQRALADRVRQLAQQAMSADGGVSSPAATRALQRLDALLAELGAWHEGPGQSQAILELERQAAREAGLLQDLRRPRQEPTRDGPGWRRALRSVGFYLAVMLAVLVALAVDLLAQRSPSYTLHPFWVGAGCAALTVYLPELAARSARPRGSGTGLSLHELAFLPAYLVFPVLPAAALIHAFPTAGMFLLMMAVSALMSLLLILGMSARKG